MKYAIALAPLSALALAACGDAPDDMDDPKSFEEVAEAAASLDKPLAGAYTSRTELTELSIPGQTASETDQMMGAMGSQFSSTSSTCVTQEEIDKGFEDKFREIGEGMQGFNCEFDRFNVDGNAIDAKLACTGQGGIAADMTMVGNIESERQTVDMTMEMSGPQFLGGEMSMKIKVVSERTGDCS